MMLPCLAWLLSTRSFLPAGMLFKGKPTPIFKAAAVGTIIGCGARTTGGLTKSSTLGKFLVGQMLKIAEWCLLMICCRSTLFLTSSDFSFSN